MGQRDDTFVLLNAFLTSRDVDQRSRVTWPQELVGKGCDETSQEKKKLV